MSDKEISCLRCQGQMEEGFIVDLTYGGQGQERWMPGKPVKSFWSGVKVDKEEMAPVATYKCKECGFLESYVKE